MKKRTVQLLFTLFIALTTAMSATAACNMKLYASLDAVISDEGAVLLPANINGRDVWMILNMSAGLPSIYPAAVRELGLAVSDAKTLRLTAGSVPVEHRVTAESLRLGGADFRQWSMYVIPGNAPDLPVVAGKRVAGLLTSNFMSVVDVELDLARSKVNLFAQTRCKGEAVYWGGEAASAKLFNDSSGLMLFPMEVDKIRIETALNTSSSQSRLSATVARKFFAFNSDSAGESANHRAMSFTAEGLTVRNVPVYLQDDTATNCQPTAAGMQSRAIGFAGCYSSAPLSMGTDLLRKLRVYIAPKEERIYFTRADPTAPPLPITR